MCKSHKMSCIWPQGIKTNTMLVSSNIWFVYYRSQPLVNYTTNDNAWLMPHWHQTLSQYVLQNFAERGQTVCERNECCDNCLVFLPT